MAIASLFLFLSKLKSFLLVNLTFEILRTMKNINTRFSILALAAFALALSSCSQQRYSSRSYVKKEVVAQVEVKKQEVAQLPVIPAPQAQSVEAPRSLTPQAIEVSATQEAKVQEPEKVEAKASSAAGNGFMSRVKERAAKEVVKRLDKTETADSSGDINLGNTWVRLIIIGLIILLIGIILPGAIGTVFYIVGSILMLVGLIFLLISLL